MKKKITESSYVSISYKNLIIIATCVLLVSIAFGFFITNTQKFDQVPDLKPPIIHRQPTAYPTPTIDLYKQGFSGYDKHKNWFDLTLPPECVIEKKKETFGYRKIITCPTKSFTVIFDPEAGRGEVETTETTEITLNQIIWSRFTLANDPEYSILYQMNTNANTYLLGVKFEPLTHEAQTYFETILASFHFIN